MLAPFHPDMQRFPLLRFVFFLFLHYGHTVFFSFFSHCAVLHFKINIWILISKKFTLGPGSFEFSLLCLPFLGARRALVPPGKSRESPRPSVCTLIKYTHTHTYTQGPEPGAHIDGFKVENGLTQSSNMQHLLSYKI